VYFDDDFRWGLIAGRIPGRKPEEIERFWMMRHHELFANTRNETENPNVIFASLQNHITAPEN